MNFGSTPETFGLLIILAFVGMLVLGLLWKVTRLVARVIGLKNDSVLLAVFALSAAGFLFVASLAIDRLGKRTRAVVTARQESVEVTRRGDWKHGYTTAIRVLGNPPQVATLRPSATVYDQLLVGDTLTVKLLRAGPLSVMRDARESTATLVPWRWLAIGMGAILILIVAWRLVASPTIVLVALVALAIPVRNARRDLRAAEDASGFVEEARATVREVHRVTEWSFTSGRGGSSPARGINEFKLRVPYDVVTAEFTPRHFRGTVLGVDAVDVAAGAAPGAIVGQPATVHYAPSAPRDIRLDGRSRRWHWDNVTGVYADLWMVLALLLAGSAIWAYVWSRIRARRIAAAARPRKNWR